MIKIALYHPFLKHPPRQKLRSPLACRHPEQQLEEAIGLVKALGFPIVSTGLVPLRTLSPATALTTGKIEEIAEHIKNLEVSLVVLNHPITPVQQRNLEKIWNVKVIDRTGLILEIFAKRAATREGVLQVDLAQLLYQKSRLVKAWSHLERQRGGGGFIGGPGETQKEADRRMLDDKIRRIQKKLVDVVRTRTLHRQARRKIPFPIIALVGYTNAGKSTLFNSLTGADVLAQDQLFATLDPTMRHCRLPNGQKIIISDTVGFIADLPTQLIAAFRATLEEVLEATIILHVRDASHPEWEAQKYDVQSVLEDLDVLKDTKIIEVWNKSDKLSAEKHDQLTEQAQQEGAYLLSGLTGSGSALLLQRLEQELIHFNHQDEILQSKRVE